MPHVGCYLFVLSYTRKAILSEHRAMFGLRHPFVPLITGTILLVRSPSFCGHCWIDVKQKDVGLN